jgi:hypothetical protein
MTLCRPLSYGPHTAPSKEDGGTLERRTDVCLTPAQDDTMTSDQRDASPPSPSSLCGHSCYHTAIRALQCHPCRMDLPGPTTSVGTRTDYSVGPWDYPTCAPGYLLA